VARAMKAVEMPEETAVARARVAAAKTLLAERAKAEVEKVMVSAEATEARQDRPQAR